MKKTEKPFDIARDLMDAPLTRPQYGGMVTKKSHYHEYMLASPRQTLPLSQFQPAPSSTFYFQ
jgi:hypothetical protein